MKVADESTRARGFFVGFAAGFVVGFFAGVFAFALAFAFADGFASFAADVFAGVAADLFGGFTRAFAVDFFAARNDERDAEAPRVVFPLAMPPA